jgi:hypothetical protein
MVPAMGLLFTTIPAALLQIKSVDRIMGKIVAEKPYATY